MTSNSEGHSTSGVLPFDVGFQHRTYSPPATDAMMMKARMAIMMMITTFN